jgi:regulator of cell morphogenesis and NO signaling
MINIAQQTLAAIVTDNSQTVPVLEKYHLDFCCKGKRTLAEACMEKGLLVEEVVQEFNSVVLPTSEKHMPFTEMSCEQLIGYILVHHHFYVKQIMPTIAGHLEKIAGKHGERFPYMQEVYNIFLEVLEDMSNHMQKEEIILFPRIKKMEEIILSDNESAKLLVDVSGPITVMMNEHDQAGDLLYAIRALTNHYTVPEGACTTFKVCLSELKEFEEDLHRHVHLENNHLFPKALGLAVAE